MLTGIYRQDEGRFRFEGKVLENATPDRIARLGIARTFQNIRLFANLSALENVMIGRHVRTRAGVFGAILRGPGTRAEERAIEKRARELLDYVGIGRAATSSPSTSPTATSAASRSRARSPPSRGSSRSTSPPRA